MQPRVTNVREQNTLGNNGQITRIVVVTYMVGTFGPFTLYTNQADLQTGKAQQEMQTFANTLGTLPTAGA